MLKLYWMPAKSSSDIDIAGIRKRRRQKIPLRSSKDGIGNFSEVEPGLAEAVALDEADRCLQCGMYPKRHT